MSKPRGFPPEFEEDFKRIYLKGGCAAVMEAFPGYRESQIYGMAKLRGLRRKPRLTPEGTGTPYYHRPYYKNQKDNPDRKLRKCLRCEEDFKSEWIGNRVCKGCARLKAYNIWGRYHDR